MSFEQVALQDFPSRLWMLDGASPFVEHTKFGSAATTTSTATHAALIKGAQSAIIVGNLNKLTFDAPVLKSGKEDQSFTIEVAVRPIRKEESVAQQQIFGTASVMDGIVLAGTVLSFTTKYTSSGEARCSFDLQEYRTVRIAAIHTKARNALYVDGDLVDEVAITDAQQADTYVSVGTSLTSGTTTSTNLLALNGLTIFNHALSDIDIDQHFREATDNMDEFTVGAAFGGATFALNSSTSIPLLEHTFTDDEDWNSGRMSGTVVENGQIMPQEVNGVSMPGVWESIIPLPTNSTLSSLTLNWQGEGETVQTSLDGLNWFTEIRSARVSTINDGFTTANKFFYVRVTFPGGKTDDKAYFDSLVATAYGPIATVAPQLETRTLSMSNASIEVDYDITDYHENWGIEINAGSMSLSGSSQTAISPQTIQVWVKKGLTGTFTDNLFASAANWYTNNGTYQQVYQTDEWQLRTYTYTVPFSDSITFTGTGQIGCILIYPYVMTAQQVADSYTAFTGTKKTTFDVSGNVSIIDLSSAVEIYEYDWAIETAG